MFWQESPRMQDETTILLARHGQTRANAAGCYMGWSDDELDECGWAEARRLSSRLASLPIAAVYSSPLQRACSTAQCIAQPHNLMVVTLDDLGELRLGDWEGMPIDEVKRKWPDLWRQSRLDPTELTLPNGESYREVTERAVRCFRKIVVDNGGMQAVVVTHEAIVRVLVAQVLGVSNSIHHRLQIDNGSVTVLQAGNRPLLVKLNDTSHLEKAYPVSPRAMKGL